MNIPENAVQVKLTISQEAMTRKAPVYISIPVAPKPVKEKYVPFNLVEHAKNSEDNSVKISVVEWEKALEFIDPASVQGKERSEYKTAAEELVEQGIIVPTFINDKGEEIVSAQVIAPEPIQETEEENF